MAATLSTDPWLAPLVVPAGEGVGVAGGEGVVALFTTTVGAEAPVMLTTMVWPRAVAALCTAVTRAATLVVSPLAAVSAAAAWLCGTTAVKVMLICRRAAVEETDEPLTHVAVEIV